MGKPLFTLANGDVSMYALNCGHGQSFMLDGKSYYGSDTNGVMLSYNGCTFDVFTRIIGVTHDWQGFPYWLTDSASGAKYRADWQQTDTLTEARKLFRSETRRVRLAG